MPLVRNREKTEDEIQRDISFAQMMLNRILLTCMENPEKEMCVRKTRAGQYVIRSDEPEPEQEQPPGQNMTGSDGVKFSWDSFQRMDPELLKKKNVMSCMYPLDVSFLMYDSWMKKGNKVAVLETGFIYSPEAASFDEYSYQNHVLDPVFYNSTLYPSLLTPGIYDGCEDYVTPDGLPMIVSPNVRMFSPVTQDPQPGELLVMTALLPWTSQTRMLTVPEQLTDEAEYLLTGFHEDEEEDESLKPFTERAGDAFENILRKIFLTARKEECDIVVLNAHQLMMIVRQMLRMQNPEWILRRTGKKLLTERAGLLLDSFYGSFQAICFRDPTPEHVYKDCIDLMRTRYSKLS